MFQKGCASRYGKSRFFTASSAPMSYNTADQLHGFCANPLREYAEDKATASRAKFEQEQHDIQEREERKRYEDAKSKRAASMAEEVEIRKRVPQAMTIDNVPSDRLLKKPKTEEEIADEQKTKPEKMEIQSEEPLTTNQRMYYTEIVTKK